MNNNPLRTSLVENNKFDGWPTLKIENINGNVGYLMPFRFYSFQICGNQEGNMDLGSSEPKANLMLDIVKYNEPMVAKCLLAKEICTAINSYMSNNYGYNEGRHIAFTFGGKPQYTYFIVNYIIPDKDFDEFFRIEDLQDMNEFIDLCYEFVIDYYGLRGLTA